MTPTPTILIPRKLTQRPLIMQLLWQIQDKHNLVFKTRFNTLSKLLAVTSYVLRLAKNLRNTNSKTTAPLTVQELKELHCWIKTSQTLVYSNDIANLHSNRHTRLPLVRQLRLFLDSDGFLHCGRRINDATLHNVTKFPFLLPPKHPFTKLIVHDVHQKQLHFGVKIPQLLHYARHSG